MRVIHHDPSFGAKTHNLSMGIKTKVGAVFALAILLLPGISSAQTVGTQTTVTGGASASSLEAEIQSLNSQLQSLETAQSEAQGGLVVSTSSPWCYTLSTNIGEGSTGPEVSALQEMLEKNGESVPVTGYFGNLTAAAVTAFQNKYASAILTPNGLANGTRYAGKATRAKLNSLFGCGPTLLGIDPSSGPAGMQATLTGTGFILSNEIILDITFWNSGDEQGCTQSGVISPNGTSLTFTVVPVQSCDAYGGGPGGGGGGAEPVDLSSAIYSVSVQNANGTSNSLNFTVTSGTISTNVGTF
jgi:hypothetical protein